MEPEQGGAVALNGAHENQASHHQREPGDLARKISGPHLEGGALRQRCPRDQKGQRGDNDDKAGAEIGWATDSERHGGSMGAWEREPEGTQAAARLCRFMSVCVERCCGTQGPVSMLTRGSPYR